MRLDGAHEELTHFRVAAWSIGFLGLVLIDGVVHVLQLFAGSTQCRSLDGSEGGISPADRLNRATQTGTDGT
jgi:hypothetical protein